jgi:transcriptional regulator with XRE-family HTH domain
MPQPYYHPAATQQIRRDIRRVRFAIGERIHAQRQGRQITLVKMANLTGIPAPVLDRYELGKDDITLLDIVRLARALHMSVEELLSPQ